MEASSKWPESSPAGMEPRRVVKCRVSGYESSVQGTATGWTTVDVYSVPAVAVVGIPGSGFLPLRRCLVVPLPGCFQSPFVLVFGQLINLRINRCAEEFDVVVPRQSAAISCFYGCCLADSSPHLFINEL